MLITRRQLLGSAAALAAGVVPAFAQTQTADGFTEIRARPARLGLLEGGAGKTDAWLLGDPPGPAIIRARQGQQVKLRFINDLEREVWLHFFGVRGPTELMTINVPPGADEAVDCVFTPPDAGTFWLAPISDQSRLRDMGLQAVFVVEEAELAAPLSDQVLVLDDWKLTGDGAVEGEFGDIETMVGEGRLGNWFTLNNRFRPRIPLAADSYTRLRLVNAANSRTMKLLMKGYDPLLIARDGQPVKPALLHGKPLELAPGQRADLLVGPEQGDIGLALDVFGDVSEIGYLIAPKAGAAPAAIAENFTLPPNPVSLPEKPEAARAIAVTLQGGLRGGLTSAVLDGAERDLRTLLANGKGWAVNGVAGPSPEPLFTAVKGETVRLDIRNATAFPQPLHIHGHVCQPAAEPQAACQDTAILPPGETLSLAFRADNPGLWALHALVAERADGGLITSFRVDEAE